MISLTQGRDPLHGHKKGPHPRKERALVSVCHYRMLLVIVVVILSLRFQLLNIFLLDVVKP